MHEKYEYFHMQMLTADGKAIIFTTKLVLFDQDKLNQCRFIKATNINT